MLNLATLLESSTRTGPGKTAVVFGPKKFSYAEIDGAANKVAAGLKRAGIGPGDRVALSSPNLPYFAIVYFGILKAGGVVVPLNVLFKRREIAYHLQDSGAAAYVCFQGTEQLPMGQEGWAAFQQVDACRHFWMLTPDPAAPAAIDGVQTLVQMMASESGTFETEARTPEDPAVILYTSGTTGKPKGAELTHSNMVMNAWVSRSLFDMKREEIHLVALPLFHSFGQTCQMNTGLLSGNTLVLIPRFDPDAVFAALEKENVTLFCGVPTMFWALLNHKGAAGKYDLEKIAGTLRLGVSGGASMPVEVLRAFEEKFNIPILEGYGLSETSPVASFNHLERERKVGSIGQPVWGVEMKIADQNGDEVKPGETGEVLIRGHNVMRCYHDRPEETRQALRDGWFHTGDAGKMDEEGYFYIVDRIKDMILRGGYNVYPREIEETLLTHPAVSLAAVVGVPDEKLGEEIKAFIVPRPGQNPSPESIVAWAKTQMADYKYPRHVEIRESLPMTSTGKILKTELRSG